jgi:cation-transporting ATPase E
MANVTILCFDKTGTLTQNRLSVVDLIGLGHYAGDETRVKDMLAHYVGSLSTQNKTSGAIEAYAGRALNGATKVSEVAFTSARKWGACSYADGQTWLLGAPEVLLEDAALRVRASELAGQGLRVLAFVSSTSAPVDAQLPPAREPIALVVLQDQLRHDIQETLHEFKVRNIRLKVISGDNLDTVSAIAQSAGMSEGSGITGPELDAMGDGQFRETVRATSVFARISPETKRRIIAALTAQGEYVAMVGDGVNDVPALKSARLGIAMYDGAQIARDVADLVLLDNALSTLPKALREGYSTTQKIYATTRMFLTRNVYMILLFIMVGFMGLPFPGQVRLLSWAALITSGVPSALVSFGVIKPRAVWKFQRQVIGYVIIVGLIGAVALTTAYAFAFLTSGRDLLLARSVMTMMAVIFGVVVFWDVHGVIIFEPVTFKQNAREALVGVLVALIAVVVPVILAEQFEAVPIPGPYWIFLGVLSLASIFLLWRSAFEQSKLLGPIRTLLTSRS